MKYRQIPGIFLGKNSQSDRYVKNIDILSEISR